MIVLLQLFCRRHRIRCRSHRKTAGYTTSSSQTSWLCPSLQDCTEVHKAMYAHSQCTHQSLGACRLQTHSCTLCMWSLDCTQNPYYLIHREMESMHHSKQLVTSASDKDAS